MFHMYNRPLCNECDIVMHAWQCPMTYRCIVLIGESELNAKQLNVNRRKKDILMGLTYRVVVRYRDVKFDSLMLYMNRGYSCVTTHVYTHVLNAFFVIKNVLLFFLIFDSDRKSSVLNAFSQ